ncbi:hypothetical protein B0T13DRAFT_273209 [Neurospora crassa]|nr:hypothetical protein B0T13DRAFT_273209 [Neurospora crassa]
MWVEEGVEEEHPLLLLWCLVRMGFRSSLALPCRLQKSPSTWRTSKMAHCGGGDLRWCFAAGRHSMAHIKTFGAQLKRRFLRHSLDHRAYFDQTLRSRDGLQSRLRRGMRHTERWCSLRLYNHAMMSARSGDGHSLSLPASSITGNRFCLRFILLTSAIVCRCLSPKVLRACASERAPICDEKTRDIN